MKKLLGIVVLGLLWCNVGFADELTVNSLLKNGYKISKDETIKLGEMQAMKIITLTKGNSKYLCSIHITIITGPKGSKCVKH